MSLFILIRITVDWLLAFVHQGERRASKEADQEGRPFLRQCRSSTDFLWSWRMPVAAELPLRPEEISEGEGNGQSVLY